MKRFFSVNVTAIVVLSLAVTAVFVITDSFTKIRTGQSDVCLSCHEDKELYADVKGKKVSLFVSPELFKKSVHSSIECSDCHEGYNPDEVPHSKTKKDVSCRNCHDDLKGIEASVHNNVKCADCHSKHYINPAKEFSKDQTASCFGCHKSKNIQGFKTSAHYKKNLGCESCHKGGHGTTKINKADAEETCKKCHNKTHSGFDNTVHNKVLKDGRKGPTCIDCHGSHQLLSTKLSIQSEGCLKCHLDEKMFPGETKGSAKFVRDYKTSIHGKIMKDGKEAAGCIDCHGNHIGEKDGGTQSALTKAKLLETCGNCHKDVVNDFRNSAHGKAFLKGDKDAPSCTKCHGEHMIQSVLNSDKLAKVNQADMCIGCHKESKLPDKNYKGEDEMVRQYEKSAHYIALKKGNDSSAACSDCHGAHTMEKANDPKSKIYKTNIEGTCGQTACHEIQLADFTGSVHERAIKEKNNLEAPSCTNCHGNHVILKKDDDANRISSPRGVIQLCSDCHSSVELTTKYDLPTTVTESYNESFHGLATRSGSKEAAYCESCHGAHNIRPSDDTLSTINKRNLPKTCGKCHPGAQQTLFTTKIHLTDAETDSVWAYWIKRFYISLIFGLISFMIIHNVLDYARKKKANKAKKK